MIQLIVSTALVSTREEVAVDYFNFHIGIFFEGLKKSANVSAMFSVPLAQILTGDVPSTMQVSDYS